MTAPQNVGGKLPNLNGLFDTLGNVWEWCWDLLDPARYADYRVFRGGGFADDAWSVRASTRRGGAPRMHHDDVGFRVARGRLRRHGCRAGLVGGRRRRARRVRRPDATRLRPRCADPQPRAVAVGNDEGDGCRWPQHPSPSMSQPSSASTGPRAK